MYSSYKGDRMFDQCYFPFTRLLVFDPRRFIDDVTTPLSTTMRPATIVAWYGMKTSVASYPSLIDVVFDGETEVSCGHFTSGVVFL